MSTAQKAKKETVIKSLIKNLKKQGYQEFKAKSSEYQSPLDLNYNGSMKKFTPDVVGSMEEGQYDLYEVEQKINEREIQDQIAKWILFSSYSKQNGGHFYLVIPKKIQDRVENLISRMMINAKVLYIESL
tara:strand:+ start:772 stop:1161 length:390 start_codon:yes stop_codon:yes gene_type:complete